MGNPPERSRYGGAIEYDRTFRHKKTERGDDDPPGKNNGKKLGFPSQPHGIALKEKSLRIFGAEVEDLPAFSPFGTMLDYPVGQSLFEPDIPTGFLRLNPLVLQNLFSLRLELAVKRRVLQQVITTGAVALARHTVQIGFAFLIGA